MQALITGITYLISREGSGEESSSESDESSDDEEEEGLSPTIPNYVVHPVAPIGDEVETKDLEQRAFTAAIVIPAGNATTVEIERELAGTI